MNLIIAGPQGSGKGTQAELLAKKIGLTHLEIGQLLRQEAEKNNPLGEEIKSLIDRGILVPNRTVLKLLRQILTREVLKKGFILDGSPRNLTQIKWLDVELARKNSRMDKLIFLKLSRADSIKRLNSRRICPKCDRNYNLLTLPPKKDELCDDCHVKLITREDETPQAIKKRLLLYRNSTVPMINYYKKKGKVIEVDGGLPVMKVHRQILRKLNLNDSH